jgi:hypothetical protein
MKSVIDKMLDSVDWTPVEHLPPPTYTELYATHVGVLTIGDFTFKCHVLSNGQRVIDADDLERFFKR